ncbi:MAG: thiamine pyrophosphate-requiring protein [Xanthobacteraceae bacterium]
MPVPASRGPANGAESVLSGLRFHGIDYLFANAGTDFPPIIEALASLPENETPQPALIPHETAAVAMAHGYFLVSGKPQAVMVHVNVGLANAAMGVINAASDNIPIIVMSGRTPITESGRPGGRMTPIQCGQEMFHQSSLVADSVKFHYEMRFPEQGEPLVSRAIALATSAPQGPVYLSLPREPLMAPIEPCQQQPVSPRPAASPPHPDPAAIEKLAGWIEAAKAPLILVQRGDPAGRLSALLQQFCSRYAIAVAEPFSVRNVMPSAHPMFIGHDPTSALADADLIIVLDCDIPWIEAQHRPPGTVRIAHIGVDPYFGRMPVRGYRTDIAIAADPAAALAALCKTLALPDETVTRRFAAIQRRHQIWRDSAAKTAKAGCASPMSAEWISLSLSDAIDDDAVVFTELGVLPGMMMLAGPNRVFSNPHSGGLGWAMPAALGAQLADRSRLVVACMGDGSYIFANPTACHQIAEALQLPILAIIKNNGSWNAVRRSVVNAYPQGNASRLNTMPLTSLEPAPDYRKIAEASRAYSERIDHGRDLPAAFARAIKVIREERRQALLELSTAVSDTH